MQLFNIPGWALDGYVLPALGLAFWKGDWRACAVASVVLVEFATESSALLNLHPPPWYVLGLDFIILATCVICAAGSHRYWTIWASSFALLSVVTHLFRFAPGIGPWAYSSAQLVWSLLLVAALLAGVWPAARPGLRRQPQ